MRTTINIDDDLLEKATRLVGPIDRTAIVRAGGLDSAGKREATSTVGRLGTKLEDPAAQARGGWHLILVDTSVWLEHLRKVDQRLADLLDRGVVLMHPFVVGEIACGNVANRTSLIELLQQLPMAAPADTTPWARDKRLNEAAVELGLAYPDAVRH